MMPYPIEFFITHYCGSLLLTAITNFPMGLFLCVRRPRNAVTVTFGIFMLLVGWWSFTQALIGTWPDSSVWLPIAQVEHAGYVFMPSVFLHFVHALAGVSQPKRLWVSYAISFISFCVIPTRLLIGDIDTHAVGKFAVEAGPWYLAYALWFTGTVIEALVKLRYAVTRSRDRVEQVRRNFIFWASCIGYAGGLPNFLYVFEIDAYPVNPFSTYLVPIYPLVIAYAIVKHQAFDISLVIRKSLVYSVLVALMTAVYFSFLLAAEKLLQGVMGYRSLIGSVVAGFVIALGFNPLKELIQQFIDRLFFRRSQAALAKENERLLEEVRKGDQMKAVATFAAGLAHEIKNPLTAIKTFTEFLPERYEDADFREKFTRIVGQEVRKITTLVQQLLDFAKPRPPQAQPTRLAQLLDETLDFLSGDCLKRRIQVIRAYAPDEEVSADPAQMKQVFLNLLLNSLEAMDGHRGAITVASAAHDGHLAVTVTDTGPGIPKKDLAHVFEPFYTTKPSGTGLGLSIVHSIIKGLFTVSCG